MCWMLCCSASLADVSLFTPAGRRQARPSPGTLAGLGEISKHKIMTLGTAVDYCRVVDMYFQVTIFYDRVIRQHQYGAFYC